jgi:hypothetical protein
VILAGCCIKLTPPYVVLDNPTISASQNVAPPAGELSDFESQLLPAHEEYKKEIGGHQECIGHIPFWLPQTKACSLRIGNDF